MGSQLPTILDDIAAMTITGYAMNVLVGATLRGSVETADIPVRILNVIGIDSASARTVTLGGSGHLMRTSWTITDVMLYRPAGLGLGLSDIALGMTGYLAAYHQAVRGLASAAYKITDLRLRAQVLEYPTGSQKIYDGVTATFTVTDIIQGG